MSVPPALFIPLRRTTIQIRKTPPTSTVVTGLPSLFVTLYVATTYNYSGNLSIIIAYCYCNATIIIYNESMTNNNTLTLKETKMTLVDSVFSTIGGGYSAYIYKVSCGYKVDITRKNKTYVYYCTSIPECYNAINLTK